MEYDKEKDPLCLSLEVRVRESDMFHKLAVV